MTLLKFGETIINADRICYVEPITRLTQMEAKRADRVTTGATIHFAGGEKVVISDPKAMEAIAAWTKAMNHAITVVL